MGDLAARLRAHWFVGVLLIALGLWVVTIAVFALGYQGVSVESPGASVTIDLHDRNKAPMLSLAPGLGLDVFGEQPIRGTLVVLKPSPLLCRPCGAMDGDGNLGQVTHRNGDWLYKVPKEMNVSLAGLREETVSAFRTVAYNVATKERVMVSSSLGQGEQAQALANHGLVADDAHAITPAMLATMKPVSMLEENCVIFNVAFLLVIALWTIIGGPIALVAARRAKRAAGA